MFKYGTFDPDGCITGVHKSYAKGDFRKALNAHGIAFFEVAAQARFPQPEEFYVDVATKRMLPRPTIVASINKARIKAGGLDEVEVSHLPRGATLTVERNGIIPSAQWDRVLVDGDKVQMSLAQPGLYRMTFRRWPYRDLVVDLEAIE